MAELQQTTEPINWEVDKKKLPEMINVLTILTFVGCAVFALFSLYGFVNAQKSYDTLVQMQDKLDNAPDFVKKLTGPNAVENARKAWDNRLPILLLSLAGYVLCTYGAMQMRALKKLGFSIYLIGELVLPLVSTVIFLGFGSVSGFAAAFGLLFPVLFIILYATQLKKLA
jgi:hypothetical protein